MPDLAHEARYLSRCRLCRRRTALLCSRGLSDPLDSAERQALLDRIAAVMRRRAALRGDVRLLVALARARPLGQD